MKKEIFVTAGLCRIKDQIAEAARNSAEQSVETPKETAEPGHPVSVFASLPEETRKALQARRQEYEQNRRDLLFRFHEFAAKVSRLEAETSQNSDAVLRVKSNLDTLLLQLNQQQEPDEFSADFQIRLSDNFRELDHLRLELIQLQSGIPEPNIPGPRSQEGNLFSELDSVSFSQIFRVGTALFMPLIIGIILCTMIIALAIVFTFRIGL
ncbi:MAG: hypothetical protein J5858_02415 [Lentisphaeria bacterium]|nr:hypothetical protein [Lentisphaeria bacterium]